ncbi:MAG: hypothetical protein ACQEUZ_17455 [Pseudomonadota bacterium]
MPPSLAPAMDRLSGLLALAVTVLTALDEWGAQAPGLSLTREGLALLLIALLTSRVRWTRGLFAAVGAALTALAAATLPDWPALLARALDKAAFIAAFFAALATLRHAAEGSAAIRACGRFLAAQPPGRRYAALTLGGQLFGLILNYGAIALLGGLAAASAREEPDEELRAHRQRRMLLAIQRGLVSTLPWSPLAFAIAISTSLIPGASWAGAALPCLATGLFLAGLGWALDTLFKPRLSRAPGPRAPAEGSWRLMAPLVLLLALLVLLVGGLHLASGVRAVGVVMVVAPALAFGWAVVQSSGHAPLRQAGRRSADYVLRELPAYRGEIALLMLAGLIGTLGSGLLTPLLAARGVALDGLPAWVILAALVWLIPLAGQIGMNPILSVTLIAPVLPAPEALGLTPDALIVAITAGWALTGASSPFTATTLLIGALAGVGARHVGLRWNGLYTLLGGLGLTAWVLVWGLA